MKTKEHFTEVAPTWNKKVWAKDKKFADDILKFASLKGDEKALYVGVGTGEIADKFNVAEMWGLDISKGMLEQCKSIDRNRLLVGSADKLPFLDNTFDFVFCRNLLKHVDDDYHAVEEMKRVLKPGGKLFVAESCVVEEGDVCIPNFVVRTVEPEHNSFRTHEWYLTMFNSLGFENVSDRVYSYKSTWLSKWVESTDASKGIKKKILDAYHNADKGFKSRQEVRFVDDDICSIIYWSFIIGVKPCGLISKDRGYLKDFFTSMGLWDLVKGESDDFLIKLAGELIG